MTLHHACSSRNGYADLIGSYSTEEKAIQAVLDEAMSRNVAITRAQAAEQVHAAELDEELGGN